MLIVKVIEDELQRRGQASDDRKAVIRVTADLKEQFPYLADYTPERLRNIYYEARPYFRRLESLLRQHENSAELTCPKHEHED
jgi:hypothetical protein